MMQPEDVLPDTETETDEMFQNADEKGDPHLDPSDPPRRRGNKRRGHGTDENDRPPSSRQAWTRKRSSAIACRPSNR